MTYDVLVFGESLIDLIQVENSDNQELPQYRACPGGSPFNAALALGRQGVKTGFATPLSSDAFGDLLINRLHGSGATYAYPQRVQNPTSLAVVTLNNGQATYQFYREDVADRAVDFALLRSLPLPRWAQIGGLAIARCKNGEAWLNHISWLKHQGVCISFDPNIREAFIEDPNHHRDMCDRISAQAEIVKLSDEDAAYLYGNIDPIKCLLGLGAKRVALTKGERGAELATLDQVVSIQPTPLRVKGDTVGAGDTFGAAILAQLIHGQSQLKTLGDYAVTAASLNCEKFGCTPPSQAEIQRRMSENRS